MHEQPVLWDGPLYLAKELPLLHRGNWGMYPHREQLHLRGVSHSRG